MISGLVILVLTLISFFLLWKNLSESKQFSLDKLELENKKSLFILGDTNKNVYLSSRNLKASNVVSSSELSTYAILNANNLVLLESSLEVIEDNLSK